MRGIGNRCLWMGARLLFDRVSETCVGVLLGSRASATWRMIKDRKDLANSLRRGYNIPFSRRNPALCLSHELERRVKRKKKRTATSVPFHCRMRYKGGPIVVILQPKCTTKKASSLSLIGGGVELTHVDLFFFLETTHVVYLYVCIYLKIISTKIRNF